MERRIETQQVTSEILPDQNAGLSPSLPQNQQDALDRIDQGLVDRISEGPSSLIDQLVVGTLQNLTRAEMPRARELLFTPRAAWQTFSALQKEKNAQASLRNTVAETALGMAKLAEDDMKAKVFGIFINNLRKTYGDSIQVYCEEHGIPAPQEGSNAEQLLLIRINSTQLGLAKYKERMTIQWEKFAQQRADLEGQIAMSEQ